MSIEPCDLCGERDYLDSYTKKRIFASGGSIVIYRGRICTLCVDREQARDKQQR